jgi:hypothetical protein
VADAAGVGLIAGTSATKSSFDCRPSARWSLSRPGCAAYAAAKKQLAEESRRFVDTIKIA